MSTATATSARPHHQTDDDERQYRGYVVDLEAFSGPLDLLLHLIRREQIDVFDIPIARITDQYLAALAQMRDNRVQVTGEFMVMAATLMQIKARLLLPKPPVAPGEEEPEDPRQELVDLLLEYQRYQEAARVLGELVVTRGRMLDVPGEALDGGPREVRVPSLGVLFEAYRRVLTRSVPPDVPKVRESPITVAERVVHILAVTARGPVPFDKLFGARPTRLEVVVTFMALLELVRGGNLVAEQDRLFGTITLRRRRSRAREQA